MRRGAALATSAAAARLGPERRAGGYRCAGRGGEGTGGAPWPKGTRGPSDRWADPAAGDTVTGAAPPHRPPPPLPALSPLQIPCRSLVSPLWSPTLPFPSPIPLQIPLQCLPAGGLCVASLHRPPPRSAPSSPLSLTPPPFPLLSPFRPRAKEGEGDPPAASREWRGGRGRPVPSESYRLSKSGSPPGPCRGGTEVGAQGRSGAAGGREGEAALPAPPPHAQHPPRRPLPRTSRAAPPTWAPGGG